MDDMNDHRKDDLLSVWMTNRREGCFEEGERVFSDDERGTSHPGSLKMICSDKLKVN